MPGICGVIDFQGQVPLPAVTEMVASLCPHSWFHQEIAFESERARLASISFQRAGWQSHIAVAADGTVCLLDGEIHEIEELQLQTVEKPSSDAELLLRGWRLKGPGFLRNLNGSFAAAIWDPNQETLVLISDRFGSRPLYFCRSKSRMTFSSRLKGVVSDPAVNRTTNQLGLAQFLTFGCYLGEETSLAEVRVLPAGSFTTWQARSGEWLPNSYHSWSESYAPKSFLSYNSARDWVDHISVALANSVKRQSQDTQHLGILVSGEPDERLILASMKPAEVRLRSLFHGDPQSLNARCAEEVAALSGCEHCRGDVDENYLQHYSRHASKLVELTDGQLLTDGRELDMLSACRNHGVEVLLSAQEGDLFHLNQADEYSVDATVLNLRSPEDVADCMCERLEIGDSGSEPFLLVPQEQANLKDLARGSLEMEIKQTAAPSIPQRIAELWVRQRLRRETALKILALRSVVETRLPFLDNTLISLLLSAPPPLTLGDEVSRTILQRRQPQLLEPINPQTGVRIGAANWQRTWSAFARRSSKMFALSSRRENGVDVRSNRALVQLAREVLLDEQSLDRGWYDRSGIEAALNVQEAGGQKPKSKLLAMTIFELGQRYLGAE